MLSSSQLIIRSHEGPDAREKRTGFGGMDEGYTIDHVLESGKLITVFSAPDYPQFQVSIGSFFLRFVADTVFSCLYLYGFLVCFYLQKKLNAFYNI